MVTNEKRLPGVRVLTCGAPPFFGFEAYFRPGALIGATRTAEFYSRFKKFGYSNQICSYTTSDIGAFVSNDTPLKKHYGLSSVPCRTL
jgi:hypothetical protein